MKGYTIILSSAIKNQKLVLLFYFFSSSLQSKDIIPELIN